MAMSILVWSRTRKVRLSIPMQIEKPVTVWLIITHSSIMEGLRKMIDMPNKMPVLIREIGSRLLLIAGTEIILDV